MNRFRTRALTRLLAAATAVVAGLAGALAATPAAAGPTASPTAFLIRGGDLICIEKIDNGRLTIVCLYPIWEDWRWAPDELIDPPGCPVCVGLGLDFSDTVSVPDQQLIGGALHTGYQLLDRAELATEPATAEALRAEAWAQFTVAARVGIQDPDGDPARPVPGHLYVDEGVFVPGSVPELAEAGAALREALHLLATGEQELVAEAADLLDRSHQQLTGWHTR